MFDPSAYVHCGIGLLTVLISVPLVLRKVPMNHWYGVRLPKAFASERNWYAINAYGGRWLIVYGIWLMVFGLFAGPYAPPASSPWSGVFVVGPLLVLFPLLLLINAYARRLPD